MNKILYMKHVNSSKSDIIFEILAQLLKEKRVKKNKSLRILAYEYDLPKSLLSRIENALNEPKLFSLWKTAEALGLKPSELFTLIQNELPDGFSLTEI